MSYLDDAETIEERAAAVQPLIESGHCVLGIDGHYDYWGNYVPSRYEVEPGTKGSASYAHELTGLEVA